MSDITLFFLSKGDLPQIDLPYPLNQRLKKNIDIKQPLLQADLQNLRNILSIYSVDVLQLRRKQATPKLFLADMDSTIVDGETLDDLAEEAGTGEMVKNITRLSMEGKLDFKQAIRERVALLKGRPASLLEKIRSNIRLNPGAVQLVKGLRERGCDCVLVSGGFTCFTAYVSELCGFHEHHGNAIEVAGGIISGNVSDPVLDQNTKLYLLETYTKERHLQKEETMAIGDGANDLAMLKNAGVGIAYRGKTILKHNLDNHLDYADMDSLLTIKE